MKQRIEKGNRYLSYLSSISVELSMRFLHFVSAEKQHASGLTDKIINILESCGLEYKENLAGQAYDDASVMSGSIQVSITEQAKHAFYIHCNAHCLNSVLVDTVKSVPVADHFFSSLERLYVFTSGSYVHQKLTRVQIKSDPVSFFFLFLLILLFNLECIIFCVTVSIMYNIL